jgi:hypothetical protein
MTESNFVICTTNGGYEVSLERRKLYEVLPDSEAEKHAQIRIIDESGEDYLYPESFFVPVKLPSKIIKELLRTAA